MAEWLIEGRNDAAAGAEFEAQVTDFRSRYDNLLETLGRLGTEVMRDRTLEVDRDIKPKKFVRHATHGFIFPPQPDNPIRLNLEVIPGTPPYTLTIDTLEVPYDADAVEGHLIVEYDDSGNVPTLRIRDGLEHPSELPPEVVTQVELSVGAQTG
jgi:hypothetical protein